MSGAMTKTDSAFHRHVFLGEEHAKSERSFILDEPSHINTNKSVISQCHVRYVLQHDKS